jgi:DNA-binding CsgD family transcriptional regulator
VVVSGPFHRALGLVAEARDEGEVRDRVMDACGALFGARAWGFYLLDDHGRPALLDVRGVPDGFVTAYEAIGRAADPVMHAVRRTHAPAHNLSVLNRTRWQHCVLYREVSSRFGLEHIMTGPLVGGGRLIGHLNLGRGRAGPPFTADEQLQLSSLCAHVSASLAACRTAAPMRLDAPGPLTPREREIAELVAQGLTNAAVGRRLRISENGVKQSLKRTFRKLGCRNRAEMVAVLRAGDR